MKRRILCRAASAACLVSALVLLGSVVASGSASALAPTATGYWDKLGGPIPNVPDGGLFVANDPSAAANPSSPPPLPLPAPAPPPLPVTVPTVTGPTAISAVRVTGVAANKDATLSLKVASGWLAPDPTILTILACPVTSLWSPPAGGAGTVSKAPSYDCAASSTGRVAGDKSGISWLLPASFQATPGEFDVALVPNPTGLPVASAVGFDRPDGSAIHATIGSNEPPVPAAPATPVTTITPTAFGGGGAPALSYTPAPVASGVSPPASPPSTPTARIPSRPALILARLPATSRAHRLMAVIALIVLGVGWWWVGGQQVPTPRLLGALATGNDSSTGSAAAGPVAGVGRFSRPRRSVARRL